MSLTIVMYHYVRDEAPPPFRRLKARSTAEFKRQLDHIEERYVIVTAQDVIAALQGALRLPDHAAWLTFDDGYREHYEMVFPELLRRGRQGSFFPCVSSAKRRRLLEVNKVQLVVASDKTEHAYEAIASSLAGSFSHYWEMYGKPSKFDDARTRFVKTMLQSVLPAEERGRIVDNLLAGEGQITPNALYATIDELRKMVSSGMYIGFHGSEHVRLAGLDGPLLRREITESLQMLEEINAPIDHWIACYPHGSCDTQSDRALQLAKCVAGLTVEHGVAEIGKNETMRLPRVDTNFLPI